MHALLPWLVGLAAIVSLLSLCAVILAMIGSGRGSRLHEAMRDRGEMPGGPNE